jgi:CHASE2 domain
MPKAHQIADVPTPGTLRRGHESGRELSRARRDPSEKRLTIAVAEPVKPGILSMGAVPQMVTLIFNACRDAITRLRARWKSCLYCARLSEMGLRYWLSVIIIITVCTVGSGYVYEHLNLEQQRSALFQWLLEHGPRPPAPKDVKIVLVEDDEYWLGDPAGRQPIKRTYLKNLVTHLADAKAYVIALDFDLRASNPDSTAIPADYEQETLELIETIVALASRGTKFVLATPIFYDGRNYRQDADPYQAYGLCRVNDNRIPKEDEISQELAQAIRANRGKSITCGYIYLPDDPLVIPSAIELNDKTELDSFALAVAKAGWPDLERVRNLGSKIRYANFISERKLRNPEAPIVFSASAVFQKGKKEDIDAVKTAFGARPLAVIVGGNWSTYAVGRGPPVDEHQTPVGSIPGADLAVFSRRGAFRPPLPPAQGRPRLRLEPLGAHVAHPHMAHAVFVTT